MPSLRRRTLLIVLLLSAAIATVGWWIWGQQPPLAEGLIQSNGRIEGDHYAVASKQSGRVKRILVHEGDSVMQGQILAELEAAQMDAQVNQVEAALEVARAQFAAGQSELATWRKEVPLRIDTASANVTFARAARAAARARMNQAHRDADRLRTLLKKNTVDKERVEQSELALKVARSDATTANAAVTQAEKQLAETKLGWDRLKAKEDAVVALQAQVRQAEALLTEARSNRDDLTIVAPAAGVVTERIVEKGKMLAAGTPLFDIVDLDHLYLKVYVPEQEIGKLRLGLEAQIHIDAFPDQPFAATVRYIAAQAEFTPKEVQTPDERVKLVYAVKLYLEENPEHRLAPGLPADAMIRWREDTPWAKPRW